MEISIRQSVQLKNAPPEAVTSAASALNWISQKKNWLMIYDNVDMDGGYKVVEKYLPPGPNRGNILITSINKELERITGENMMEVLEMEGDEALSLLEKSARLDYKSESIKDQAQKLVSKLGGFPLAIDQAGAYMRSCNCCLNQYLELFIKQQNQLLSEPVSFRGASDYGRSTYGTWDISMREIEARASNRQDPNRAIEAGSAITLWNIFAWLSNEDIPAEQLFRQAAKNYKARDINKEKNLGLPLLVTALNAKVLFLNEEGEWDEICYHGGIRVLLSFSLIRGYSELYSIHSLFHSWSRHRMPRTEIGQQYLVTRALLSCSVKLYDRDDHKFCRLLAPHIRASKDHAKEFHLEHSYYDDECDRFSHVFYHIGSWKDAEDLQACMINAREAKLGPDHKMTLISIRQLGYIYKDQAMWGKAEEKQMQATERSRAKLGDNELDNFTLGCMSDLAVVQMEQENTLSEAERLLVKVKETCEAELKSDHRYTLLGMENLATVYIRQGRYNEAEKLLLHVVDVRNSTLGSSNYDTLFAKHTLGSAYFHQEKWDEAARLYFEVFEARREATSLGSNHLWQTLDSMGMLGNTYIKQGKINEGKLLLSQAAELLEKIFGSQHQTTLYHRRALQAISVQHPICYSTCHSTMFHTIPNLHLCSRTLNLTLDLFFVLVYIL